ncbi:hypothetical protein LJR098_002340 [Rhizobium sp. LjRoot98]|uniref:hypothetical protein n=1 Tax=unclassified Rhizobium TaxID=2613769 RepID=UPI000A62773D|nr:hypothetical protein [Rhizobium sp. Root1204]
MREKELREIEGIAATIRRLVTPGVKPKALIAAVKERHPKTATKEIARTTF